MKKVALLGYGTVGSGVYELIAKNHSKILKKYSKDIQLEKDTRTIP